MKSLQKILFSTLILFGVSVFGQVRLPKLISDGMILQRDAKIKIWGWASPNESISITFVNKKYQIKANNTGEWELNLSNLKPGGPFLMTIKASNTIEINEIYIGDVWLCSGQSNMAMTVGEVSKSYQEDIANSENKLIRTFLVPREVDFIAPRTDLSGGSWMQANPKNQWQFSAAAYFFAKELQAKLKIPIGLVNASLGSTYAECWMSEKVLKPFPDRYKEIQQAKNPEYIMGIANKEKEEEKNWDALLQKTDEGVASKKNWISNATKTNDWVEAKVAGYWNTNSLVKIHGAVWYKKEIEISKSIVLQESILELGNIVGIDSTYVNGKLIGNGLGGNKPRKYVLPANSWNEGLNTITVRICNKRGNGGFAPGLNYAIISKNEKIDLSGIWKSKLGAKLDQLPELINIKLIPSGLYNAMIEPIKKFKFKGAIWYQGEANVRRPVEYGKILPALINNWRSLFNDPKLPFLFVQLPNFMVTQDLPSESNWALLRESQLKTLAIPYTGMATTIDIGTWNDIHPHQKKEVGTRLAIAAQKVAYNNSKTVFSGPLYKSMQIEKDKIILSFSTIGSAMQFKGQGTHTNFAIAGEDKKFVWADAKIENGKITVWSAAIPNPIAVRYAWADNPEGEKLYNTEGLPASPFRTDSW
ncbi:sialate O-acetylesterase [Flavobacterium sp.]|uniref:sialate O-acetylesterase n=1 Tax=Flavobacterium sp. TaxID=239 RepID=UPI00286DF877|nr:sialate O-acetylesterase [Flavobacterium sp.]